MHNVASVGLHQRGARSEHSQDYVTDEQQSWCGSAAATQRAGRLAVAVGVTLRSQSAAFVAHRSLPAFRQNGQRYTSSSTDMTLAPGGASPPAELVMPMDIRLTQLVESFVGAQDRYALARLEFALRHPREPAPPLLDRLSEPLEPSLRALWPQIEIQLQEALAFSGRLERSRPRKLARDEAYRHLQRSLRELDQCARAIRWVLTVTESTNYDL